MSSYDKVVKLACKPKAAPPKAKYIDPIIAATWADDGSIGDVCKALSPRFREPNAIVVFKALIVLHTMIRNGATDKVLSYLASGDTLRLSNVSTGAWEGYTAPENMKNYSMYLESRIKAYRDLKHDAIRVQAESNRDMRNTNAIEEDNRARGKAPSGPSRSKTIMGRKLRMMTVEKGLLRETRIVHRMIDSLVECRFYLDNLEDELTTTALRMLVKDLLILFQAGNEGVINVLEHYFEMSHVDAEEALRIYRHFCKQTEKVVEFLGVAKKLQNLLNVPIPNLKHAPVSLAGALQEYLDDPNFEQNRIEYKTNKEAAERSNKKNGASKSNETSSPPPVPSMPSVSSSAPATSSSSTPASKNDAVIDFFQSIEDTQPTMFNPQTNSPNTAYFQQQSTSNPFHLMGISAQPTGFIAPQPTSFQPAFVQQQLQPQPTGHRPFSSFIPPQATGFIAQSSALVVPSVHNGGLLQPQMTGSNPFRQSMLVPQTTGMQMFGVGGAMPFTNNSNNTGQMPGQPTLQGAGVGFQGQPNLFSAPSITANSFSASFMAPQSTAITSPVSIPPRPASTPLTSIGSTSNNATSPPIAQPVKTHVTGTRNPFGPVATAVPPVPRQPTLMELTMAKTISPMAGQDQVATFNPALQSQSDNISAKPNGFSMASSALAPGATDMAGVASSFIFNKNSVNTSSPTSQTSPTNTSGLSVQNTAATSITGSAFSDTLFSTNLSSQSTGATSLSSSTLGSASPAGGIKPALTGFSGLKPFKPSSSFGASLMETLPPIPGSVPSTPAITGAPQTSPLGGMSSGGTSPFGVGNITTTRPFDGMSSGGASLLGIGNGINPSFDTKSITATKIFDGSLNSQPTGLGTISSFHSTSTIGIGLRPQMTGGAGNPFRASMLNPTATGFGALNAGMNGGIGSNFNSTNTFGPLGTTNPNSAAPSLSLNGQTGLFGTSALNTGLGTNPLNAQQSSDRSASSLL